MLRLGQPTSTGTAAWRWDVLAGLLLIALTASRLAYLAFDCPLDLAPDEAHYWDWSRNLDWSYYSKGPLVAFLIRASTELTGAWCERLTGNIALAVRLPAVLCGALWLISLYVLTVQVFGRRPLALAVIGLALTLPLVAAGSLVMTIDAPYTCCWGWALVLGHRAVFRQSTWAWPLAGLVVGLGILAKYTMVVWPASFAMFLLATPQFRGQLRRSGFWTMAATAALCCLPIVFWNVRHGLPSLRHVLGQAGLAQGQAGMRWWGPFQYLAVQFSLLLGFWFIAWMSAMLRHRPWKEPDDGIRYLWWLSAPMFGLFFLFSARTSIEPNWPVTAYHSGLVLAVFWISRRLQFSNTRARRLTAAALATACALGLTLTLALHHSERAHPLLVRMAGPPSAERPLPLRRLDPTCRMRGWRRLAGEVDLLRRRLRDEGEEAILAGDAWTLPGELGFYCEGHPHVYSLGLVLGDRMSQYDLWHPNPLADPEQFTGRTMIFVGEIGPQVRVAFDRMEQSRIVTHHEQGQPLACWRVRVCRGFRGCPQDCISPGSRRY